MVTKEIAQIIAEKEKRIEYLEGVVQDLFDIVKEMWDVQKMLIEWVKIHGTN